MKLKLIGESQNSKGDSECQTDQLPKSRRRSLADVTNTNYVVAKKMKLVGKDSVIIKEEDWQSYLKSFNVTEEGFKCFLQYFLPSFNDNLINTKAGIGGIPAALMSPTGDACNVAEVGDKSVCTSQPNKLWLTQSPIYIVNANKSKGKAINADFFPTRILGKSCYLCGDRSSDVDMMKCAYSKCKTRFHLECARNTTLGGYTFEFMDRSGGRKENHLFCSRHHCTSCFADFNRTRCFNGKLINCDQCDLAWHPNCIPGGCEIISDQITCPRHVAFPDFPSLHLRHCADCQKKGKPGESLVKCTKCFRSLHFKCYSNGKSKPIFDTFEEHKNATCIWCDTFDFIRYGEYAMARLSKLKWYPCQVVSNDEFPVKNEPLLGSVGYLCVKWLTYKGKVDYNVISHNRVISMSEGDYFFVNTAHKTEIFEEWEMAQEYTRRNSALNRPLLDDQKPDRDITNGEKIRKIKHNRYSSPELRTKKDQIQIPDFCNCDLNDKARCGPSSGCINRALHLECPKGCGDGGAGCQNRRISEGNNCIAIQVEYFDGKGYGAISMEDIPSDGFVGEYVGEVISTTMREERIGRIANMRSHEPQYYIMEIDERRAIDAQYYANDMRYVNHSCDPNCITRMIQSDFDVHLVLIALRNIRKGEELSFDYNMQGKGLPVPICRCNAENCTGILSADNKVKKDRKENQAVSTQHAKKAAKTAAAQFSSSAPDGRRIIKGIIKTKKVAIPSKKVYKK